MSHTNFENSTTAPQSRNVGGGTGEGIGHKIRGAAETIHGMGENIRGTALGAVDTVVHGSQAGPNDNIAARGREETSEGVERMETGTASHTAPYAQRHRMSQGTFAGPATAGSSVVGEMPANGVEDQPHRVPPPHPRTTEGY